MIEALKISLVAFMFVALGEKPGMIFHPYQRLITHLPQWLSFPLGKCFVCFTGQVCLWYYIFMARFNIMNFYAVMDLLFFISFGIAASLVYNAIYQILNEF